MKEIFLAQKIVFPFFNSSFESHFCLFSLSCESLAIWEEKYLHPLELLEYENITNSRRKHDYLLRNCCAKQVILSCLKKIIGYAKHIHTDKDTTKWAILTNDRLYYSHLQVSVTHSDILGFVRHEAFIKSCNHLRKEITTCTTR